MENISTKDNMQYMTVGFECKALPDGPDADYFYFEGYLSTYGNVDRGNDIVKKGAFDESLKKLTPDLLWQHKYGEILGIFEEIKSDSKGLFVRGKMPKSDTLVSGRVIPQMKVGSVRSMSIGYWTQDYEWDDDKAIRTITKAMLFEGSLVSQPMNEKAEVTDMKKLEIDSAKEIKTRREFESTLRDLGASQKAAVYLASKTSFEEEPSDSDEETKGLETLLSVARALNTTLEDCKNA